MRVAEQAGQPGAFGKRREQHLVGGDGERAPQRGGERADVAERHHPQHQREQEEFERDTGHGGTGRGADMVHANSLLLILVTLHFSPPSSLLTGVKRWRAAWRDYFLVKAELSKENRR